MDQKKLIDVLQKINVAFRPSAPIDRQDLFSGRVSQIVEAYNAIHQRGQHAIIFGERGVGKTSLANVMLDMTAGQALRPQCGTINCDPTTTFSPLWHSILREIRFATNSAPMGFTGERKQFIQNLAAGMPSEVTPDDLRALFQQLPKCLIVIDEVDRIRDHHTTTLLADTIKTLSDHAIDTTIILVGVADSVDTLLAEHASIERALVQIRMPRMSRDEIHELIDKGLASAGMTITDQARSRISRLAQGLPHYAHLLTLHAASTAAMDGRTQLSLVDTKAAIQKALTHAQQSIASSYHRATSSPRENLYPQVLLACALAKTDTLGYFSASDVRDPMREIMGRPYEIPAFSQHLNAFCEEARGPVLQRTGTARRYRFRFTNPLLQPYVIMSGLENSLIEESKIEDVGRPGAMPLS